MRRPIIYPGLSCLQGAIFFLRWLKRLFAFGASQMWICWHLAVPLHASIITSWKLHYSGGLVVECLQPSLDISGRICVSSSCISSSSSVHVSGRTCQRSTQTFDSSGTILDGGSLDSNISQHIGRCSSVLSHHKRSHLGCFNRPCAQGSVISAFNPLAVESCVLHRQEFSSSVCQAVVGAILGSMKKSTSNVGRNWQVGVFESVPNNAMSFPKISWFFG